MVPTPVSFGGNATFGISGLTRIALQRCKTARCAIETMGDLSTNYGFYGANKPDWEGDDPRMNDDVGGEALAIADTKEVWVFHVSPDDTGGGAVWVAQKVPEAHISVLTNT